MSNVFDKSDKLKESTELKDLAMFFFKKGGFTAEEAYKHAQSFLSLSKNKYGQDIVDVEVKYDLVIEYPSDSPNGVAKYFLYYQDEEVRGKPAVVTFLGDYLSAEKVDNSLKSFIFGDMIPEYLKQDSSKVLKVKMVRDSDVRQLCKGVFVKKVMAIL